ncbi:MAG: ATP phosphoribosyltransferase [Gammaproteobacteria bacterium]
MAGGGADLTSATSARAALTLAISKGRIFDEALPLLASAGIYPAEDAARSRKLVIGTSEPGVRLMVLRAQDVPTFVARGAADMGIAGKDVIDEHTAALSAGSGGLYEPLDLGIARCRLMVAGKVGSESRGHPGRRLRVATKYVAMTRRYYESRGEQVEIIKLYGSMELAPLVGLADRIVDVVDTGNTLRANGLEPLEHIADISSRLVVNKAAMKMRHADVTALIALLADAVAGATR